MLGRDLIYKDKRLNTATVEREYNNFRYDIATNARKEADRKFKIN